MNIENLEIILYQEFYDKNKELLKSNSEEYKEKSINYVKHNLIKRIKEIEEKRFMKKGPFNVV